GFASSLQRRNASFKSRATIAPKASLISASLKLDHQRAGPRQLVRLMRRDDCDAAVVGVPPDPFDDQAPPLRVEMRHRLVEHPKLRIGEAERGEADPAALPGRQIPRTDVELRPETELRRDARDICRAARDTAAERQVLAHGEVALHALGMPA